MKKLHDWQIKMQAFVRERQSMPFAWGSNDCAIFAADFVWAITGSDHAPHLRKHTTAMEAARVIKDQGGLSAIATKAMGNPIGLAFATVGDIVLVKVDGREALAVCNGGTAMGPSEHGILHLPMTEALACWRVL